MTDANFLRQLAQRAADSYFEEADVDAKDIDRLRSIAAKLERGTVRLMPVTPHPEASEPPTQARPKD